MGAIKVVCLISSFFPFCLFWANLSILSILPSFSKLHSVWKSPKMSHSQFWHFSLFFGQLKFTCLVTLFDRKLYIFKTRQDWPFLAFSIDSLKMSHLKSFEFWLFKLFLSCLVTLFDRKLKVFKNSSNWPIFGQFNYSGCFFSQKSLKSIDCNDFCKIWKLA